MEQAQRLETVDLLRLYGNIEFDWSLTTDNIDWIGPLSRLISPEISLATGSSYNNLLTPHNLMRRLKGLDKAHKSKDNHYTCEYELTLSNHETATVHESGTLHYDHAGKPYSLSGFIRFIEVDGSEALTPLKGYDPWTGFPTKEILFENLASLLEKNKEAQIPGAYLSLSVDCLTAISCRFGSDVAHSLIKQVAEKLRAAIRFNDSIGRTSSACLGIILQDCDRWGIVRASDRLTKCIEEASFETEDGPIRIKVSSGGIVFPDQSLTAQTVMQKSEQYLFEAQAVRGSGTSWTPYGEGVKDLERPNKKAPSGKRRAID